MESRRLLIDTDPGVDDGVALVMALRSPGVVVEAITVVRGNTELDHAVRNAIYVTEVCAVTVPVYAGADAPLARPAPSRPGWLHGEDGFGGLEPRPRRQVADPGFAPDRIVELVMTHPGAITLVTLGPLTNIALALAREPRIATSAAGVLVMGGAAHVAQGVTPEAEFNVRTDPEAARAVIDAGFRLTMIGIELSRGDARFTEEEVAGIAVLGTPAARLAGRLLGHGLSTAARRSRHHGERGVACPDAVAIAVALDRSILSESADACVEVQTTGETEVDVLGARNGAPNARVGLSIDATRFKQLVVACCR